MVDRSVVRYSEWDTQPQFPAAVKPEYASGFHWSATGAQLPASVGSPNFLTNRLGRALVGNRDVQFAVPSRTFSSTERGLTFVFVMQGVQNELSIIAGSTADSNNFLMNDENNHQIRFKCGGNESTFVGINLTVLSTVVIRMPAGATSTKEAYKNGAYVSSSSANTNNSFTMNCLMNGYTDGTFRTLGQLNLFQIIPFDVGVEEARELSRNAYRIFEPAEEYSFVTRGAGETNGITLTDFLERRVFQRTGTSADITVAGAYTGSPSDIEARVVQYGTSTPVVGWTTLAGATIGGHSFSGTLAGVPQGGWYSVQVRFANDTPIASAGTHRFGVGMLGLCIGQSNMEKMFTVGLNVSPDLASRQNGSSYPSTVGSWTYLGTAAQGAVALVNSLIAQFGIPVGLLHYGIGATSITQWDEATDSRVQNAIKGVQDCGGELEFICFAQGEADYQSAMSRATYAGYLTTCVATFRAAITNRSVKPNLPFLIGTLGRVQIGGVTDDEVNAIRMAHFDVAGSVNDVYIAAAAFDLPLENESPPIHCTGDGFATFGARFAQTIKFLNGVATYYRGPYINSAVRVDSTHTDVNIVHRGGSDFTPTSGVVGFELDDAGSIVVPSAAVRQSATTIRLTHAVVSVAATVRYGYGTDGGESFALTISNVLADNASLALPLEQSSGTAITVIKTATVRLVNEAGSPLASLSGIKWAWFDTATPDLHAAPVNQGTGETTDASGYLQVSIASSTLSPGQVGSLEISTSDGTTTQSPAPRGWAGPVAVD